MQLNNLNNGKVVEIDSIDILNNCVFYSLYEFGGNNKQLINSGMFRFNNFQINECLDLLCNTKTVCLEHLRDEYFKDFTLSIDDKNWLRPLRIIRLIWDKKQVTDEFLFLQEHTALANILNREINNNKVLPEDERFIFVNTDTIVTYFNGIDEGDTTVIAPYLRSPENPNGIIDETLN